MSRLVALALFAALLLLVDASPGSSQAFDPDRIHVGDSVRLRLPSSVPVTGSFHGWEQDVMMLGVEGLEERWPVSIHDAESLELLTERTHREGFRYGAVVGSIAGFFIGAGVGLLLHASGAIDDPYGPPGEVVSNTLHWAGVGFGLGGIGAGIYKGRKPGRGWIRLTLPSS